MGHKDGEKEKADKKEKTDKREADLETREYGLSGSCSYGNCGRQKRAG